jgi:SanA protein
MLKKIIILFVIACILGIGIALFLNSYIHKFSKLYIYDDVTQISSKFTVLVLGAHVGKDGTPSLVLRDRLKKAFILYTHGKVNRFLLSGDHGRKNYDEVNNMKIFLTGKGVPEQDIFLDHAGFDTYNSIVRAKEIFQVHDVIIVTQEFHLSRAIYIARKKGLDAYGCVAEITQQAPLKSLKLRESLANFKAFFEVLINRRPKFLGEKIPITGDSKLSYD